MLDPRSDEKLNIITDRLRQKYKPIRLFLYGSRSNNTYRKDSDYDFVMVLSKFSSTDRHKLMSQISSDFQATINVDVQVWAYSEEEFNDWKDEFSSIPETALNTGKEINLG